MRKDWIDKQRLGFPLTEIPLAITGESPRPTLHRSIFGRPAFWAGFLLAGGTLLLWWLHRLFPAVPGPALLYPIGQSFRGAGLPWSALINVVADISPAVIGVMCLTPIEISLSLWAWFVLFRVFLVVCGGRFALLLLKLSARFVWWPLSPIGFIIARVRHTNHRLWASAFIGWLLTAVIRRYGGLRLYRQLRPAFIGLVLGHYLTDAAMALFAAVVLGACGVSSLSR